MSGVAGIALKLRLLASRFAVCRMKADVPLPAWALSSGWFSMTRTADELSIVCEEESVPVQHAIKQHAGVPDMPAAADRSLRVESGWRMLKVEGTLDFSLIGILAEIAGVLAKASVSLFVVSTFDTDYVLVKAERLETAILALREAGHSVLE